MAISALRRLCVPFLLVAVTVALLALSSGESKAQWIPNTPQFQPIFDVKLCNPMDADFSGPAQLKGTGPADCTNVTTPGPTGHPDTFTPFTVPGGHLNYDQSFWVAAGGASETRLDGSQIAGPNPGGTTGAVAGGLQSLTTLGLASNPCNNTIYPDFIWWEAEYDVNTTVACQPEGTDARWDDLATDGGDAFHGQADRNSPIVTGFPDCTLKLFDPDGDGIDTDGDPNTIDDQPVQPRARFAGLTQVPPGGDYQMLQNIEFDPGDLQKAFMLNTNTTKHPFAKLSAQLGFVNLVVLNDPTTVILQPNPISDFCTPLGTRGGLLGQIDTNGDTTVDLNRVTSPTAAGSYQVQARTMSYRDADADGIENGFDTCIWTANTAAQDPYTSSGPDTDMLDSVCDPAPGVKNDDQDGDAYLNNQDWCPLVANPLPAGETDAESAQPYNSANPDSGPPQDQIGDDCDSEQGGNDLVSDGLYVMALHVDSVCIGATDADGDGWCAADDPDRNVIDGSLDMAAPFGTIDTADDGRWGGKNVIDGKLDMAAPFGTIDSADDGTFGATAVIDGGLDMAAPFGTIDSADDGSYEGDTNVNVPGQLTHFQVDTSLQSLDSDGDGATDYTDWKEWVDLGTDPRYRCPMILGHDAWPPDFDTNRVINITDVFKVLPPIFGSSCGQANFSTRADLDPNCVINITDVFKVLPPVFGSSCSYP